MTRDEFIATYWRYYLVLEKGFMETLDFLEFHPENTKAFSNRYAMLLQAIGAELDGFFKVFCSLPSDAISNIGTYSDLALTAWPEIVNQKIEVLEKKTFLQPFKDWDKSRAKQSLPWWEAFDNIKHSRADNMKDANQENTITSLAALFLLEMKHLVIICDGKEPDLPDEPSKLFELDNWNYRFLPSGEGYAFVDGRYCMVNTRRAHWDFRR